MVKLTIEELRFGYEELGKKIAAFETQAKKSDTIYFPKALIKLAAGEYYAGLITDQYGAPRYHLILLPGDNAAASWTHQVTWASAQGGELPTRCEQALLFSNCKMHFQSQWYWAGEQHPLDSDYAWFQHFDNGGQLSNRKICIARARAIRRILI